MSEEEKEAIKEVEKIIEYIEENYTCNCDREDKEYMEKVLNLIDRLQKENEYLREREEYLEKRRSDIINTFQNKVTGTTIPKDKIKAEIKELEYNLNKMEKQEQFKVKIYSPIDIIKAQILELVEILEGE